MRTIISASRRTDIPHYYADWFRHRRMVSHVEFRNSFGGKGKASLKREDVAGFLFWTKYARPFHGVLDELRAEAKPYAFQYTITGFGASSVEPYIPRKDAAIDDFLKVRDGLPASSAIEWRYDPIVLTEDWDESFHIEQFRAIASALEGATEVVNTSFIEPYVRSIRRMGEVGSFHYRSIDPDRHKTAAKRHADIPQVTIERANMLLERLASTAAAHGMELRVCSNPEFNMPTSQCASVRIFSGYGEDVAQDLPPGPSRPGCQCLRTVDIGMDNTCIGGCKYCYVVTSQDAALRNFMKHDPNAVMIRQTGRRRE